MNAIHPAVVRVPVIPEPPHDPTSLLIDHRSDWHTLDIKDIEICPCSGSMTLALAPHAMRSLTEPSGSFGGLAPPVNVAVATDGSVLLLDRRRRTLRRFDPCECRFVDVPCLGSIATPDKQSGSGHCSDDRPCQRPGGGARDLRNPRGIAICGNTLYVADAGRDGVLAAGSSPQRNAWRERIRRENHRVSMFRLPGFELRGHLRPPRGEHPRWKPVAVACDSRGCIWVSDPLNGRVHRFTRNGRWRDAISGLDRPGAITVDACDRVYVVDLRFVGDPVVRVFDVNGKPLSDALDVNALRHWFCELPFSVGIAGTLDLVAFCQAPCSPNDGFFDGNGDPVLPPAPTLNPYLTSGTYLSEALDSRTRNCQWHRIIVRGALPTSTRLRVETFCSDERYDADQLAGFARWSRLDIVPAEDETGTERDCLILSPPGRYLWLRLTLLGKGTATPEIRALEIEFPRLGSLRYLPDAFSAEPSSADFTARFLALFDTPLRQIERVVDTEARFFDPASTPSERVGSSQIDFLSWLATWIGVSLERSWTDAQRRRFLKQSGKLFATRGTPEGLRRQLLLLFGWDEPTPCGHDAASRATCVDRPLNCAPCPDPPHRQTPPLVLEHFRLRRWLWLGLGRLGAQAVLWGRRIVNRTALDQNARVGFTELITTPDPLRDPFHYYAHRFTVFVPACVGRTDGGRRALANLLRREAPAHAAWAINYVEPRFRIGVQSMIGFDAVVGAIPAGMRLGESALGVGTLIESRKGRDRGLRVGKSGRVGTGSQLN